MKLDKLVDDIETSLEGGESHVMMKNDEDGKKDRLERLGRR